MTKVLEEIFIILLTGLSVLAYWAIGKYLMQLSTGMEWGVYGVAWVELSWIRYIWEDRKEKMLEREERMKRGENARTN